MKQRLIDQVFSIVLDSPEGICINNLMQLLGNRFNLFPDETNIYRILKELYRLNLIFISPAAGEERNKGGPPCQLYVPVSDKDLSDLPGCQEKISLGQ